MITTIEDIETDEVIDIIPNGIELDENGMPIGCFTLEEIFDELDEEFIEFYGEYGRKLVNESRMEWNKDGIWNFKIF
jgi:hypothetical protein